MQDLRRALGDALAHLSTSAGFLIFLPSLHFPFHLSPSSSTLSGRLNVCSLGRASLLPWASLVAQLVKNPPAMQETWIRSLGWRIPWSRERLPTLVFWPGEFHGLYSPWGRK